MMPAFSIGSILIGTTAAVICFVYSLQEPLPENKRTYQYGAAIGLLCALVGFLNSLIT